MQNKRKRKITAGKVVKTTLNVLFPFKSIKNSASLFIKDTQNTISVAGNIKDMASELYERTKSKTKRNDSFEDAIENSGLTINQLMSIFKRKKNIYLIALYFSVIFTIIMISYSFITVSKYTFLFSCISLGASFSIFFLLSFSCQFRLWQLKVKRLSIEEKGGIGNFMSESNWFFSSLKLETKFNLEGVKDEKVN